MSHGFSLQILIPISLVPAVCSQSSFACGISHFISEFQFNLEFNLEFTVTFRWLLWHLQWWSGCCVTAEGVFSTFRFFSAYLILEVDTDVPTPTLKFSVGWGGCATVYTRVEVYPDMVSTFKYLCLFVLFVFALA